MNSISSAATKAQLALTFALTTVLFAAPGWAAGDLIIKVSGLAAPYGGVGCSLFSKEDGFPMDNSKAKSEWIRTTGESVTCRFTDVAPGKYAVAVAHDANENRKIDTNFFGIPTEQWGVSNNVRPTMRAPKFDEAVFTVPENSPAFSIDVKVAK